MKSSVWSRFLPRSGFRAGLERVGLLVLLAVPACNYGFRGGGGFPASIETIYIEPFENQTVHFELQDQVHRRLLEDLPRSLGVQPAGVETADAIVRGRITRYDDVARNYRDGTAGAPTQVLEHEVVITLSVQIIDVARNLVLWESNGVTGRGTYLLASESDLDAREEAIRMLAQSVIDGAQSQW